MKYLLPVAVVIILVALFTLVVVSAIAYRADETPEVRTYVSWVEVHESLSTLHSGVVALATPMTCGGISSTDRLKTCCCGSAGCRNLGLAHLSGSNYACYSDTVREGMLPG